MTRRALLGLLPALMTTRPLLAAAGVTAGRLGVCTFSCHRAWQALRDKSTPVPFTDGPSFHDYVRRLGADGAQASVASLDEAAAERFRAQVANTGSYYEGDVRLPRTARELEAFEREVKLTRLAGATVARTFLSGTRRYETWKTREAFQTFHTEAVTRLALVEPVVKRHGLKLAVENHKDFTSEEFVALLRGIGSEWIGANVDTGNNLALLEDPYFTVETLAPFAFSVHLKDMAVLPHPRGFQLSEVNCGQGFLDLPRMVATLRKANAAICFNLEMATRDPLIVPCNEEAYFATFPERRVSHLASALARVASHPPKQPAPSIAGLPMARQLADEEANNRVCLKWMHEKLSSG